MSVTGGAGSPQGGQTESVDSAETTIPASAALVSGPPSRLTGTLVERESRLPLAGLRVRWLAHAREGNPDDSSLELGTALTGDDGTFTLEAGDTPESREALCRLRYDGGAGSYLVVEDATARPVIAPATVDPKEPEITLEVHANRGVSADRWRSLAEYLAANRKLLVRDVALELMRPAPDSPTTLWAAPERAAGLREMLEAIAREQEAVADGMLLLGQDQFVDTTALITGNVVEAVTKFTDPAAFSGFEFDFPTQPKSDLELYRDYLRSVWVTAAQKMYKDHASFPNAPAALLERQLDARFHQDFHTSDGSWQLVEALLVSILLSLLQADAAREGFGIQAAAIPPQGTATDAEYLQTLIALSGVDTRELRNRLRVSFDREPGEQANPIGLNVEALLGLLADTYQTPIEPFPAVPPVVEGKPLIFPKHAGRAPFFLQYEEWYDRRRTFYPENIYDLRRTLPSFDPNYRNSIAIRKGSSVPTYVPGKGYFDAYPGELAKSAAWIEQVFAVVDALNESFAKFDAELYDDSRKKLDEAMAGLSKALEDYEANWVFDQFLWEWSWGGWNDIADRRISLERRAKLQVTNEAEFGAFEAFFHTPFYPVPTTKNPGTFSLLEFQDKAIARARSLFLYFLLFAGNIVIPYVRAAIAEARADWPTAIRLLSRLSGYEVGVAELADNPGYAPGDWVPNFYEQQSLPYTTAVGIARDAYTDLEPLFTKTQLEQLPEQGDKMALAPFEQRFFKLAQGEVMLAWAGELYRNDDPSSIRRARELYKGVLFMHGEDPELAPDFNGGFSASGLWPGGWKYQQNPAKVSQVTRARLGYFQIEQGLNAYGFREDAVPVLRYKPLKRAADLFAASAKTAERDFLDFQGRFEQSQIDAWQARALSKKAAASAGIATEHQEIAKFAVDRANEQVAAVEAQIAAKQAEIDDHDRFFGQWGDYISGIKDSIEGVIPSADKVVAAAGGGGASQGQFAAALGKSFSGGTGAESLGVGLAPMVGFGVFAYVSYSSMSAMETAYAKRDADLKTLREVALPAAKAQVRLKERDVAIAGYELQIAQADLEYAQTLLRFQAQRFLNATFWQRLAQLAVRLMRRYVELGARTAWFAERALAFEQGRSIRIIRLNYLPAAIRGVTGADTLLADLAELEAHRLQGVRLTTPVKHTISLAREFPVEFGRLKKTGRCMLHTLEARLRAAYPGTFGYRIRAITVAGQDLDGPPPRGILRNGGVSTFSAEDGSRNVLVRFPDALALSEFRLHDDLFVYGLPGETLLQFEGSGFETDWELEFPPSANAKGLRTLADVLITFDMNASYSAALATAAAAQQPGPAMRSVMLAASVWDPKGFESLAASGSGPAKITFDPGRLALPKQETGRKLTNVAIACIGTTAHDYGAKLTATKAAKSASFTFHKGIALSNAGPLLGTGAPHPLNALAGVAVGQPFVLEVSRSGAAAEIAKLYDVVLYLEYETTV
jgi:hypothetical protein